MSKWEEILLGAVQAIAPTVATIAIHSASGIAIFNASDNLFNGVVNSLKPTPAPAPVPVPVEPAPASATEPIQVQAAAELDSNENRRP